MWLLIIVPEHKSSWLLLYTDTVFLPMVILKDDRRAWAVIKGSFTHARFLGKSVAQTCDSSRLTLSHQIRYLTQLAQKGFETVVEWLPDFVRRFGHGCGTISDAFVGLHDSLNSSVLSSKWIGRAFADTCMLTDCNRYTFLPRFERFSGTLSCSWDVRRQLDTRHLYPRQGFTTGIMVLTSC